MKLSFVILFAFLAFHLVILLVSPLIPIEKLYYPFREIVEIYNPFLLTPLGSFDGGHYILIAKHGYSQFQQAFFPLYPLLINITSIFTASNYLIAGLAVSWMTFGVGVYYFARLAGIIDKKNQYWTLAMLIFFPTSFFFLAMYPESLFLLTSSAALFFLFKKNYMPAVIFATLSSLTKIQGVFLIIPFVIMMLQIGVHSKNSFIPNIKISWSKLFIALSPLYGLAAYSTYLYFTYGDPLYYYHSQEAFGAERTSEGIILLPQVIYRYINILLTAQINFQYFVAIIELSIFALVFIVLLFDLYRIIKQKQKDFRYLSLNLYSLGALILPTLTGTLSSIPRYAIISFGFFFAAARIKNTFIKVTLLMIMGILHIVLYLFFIQGYFVS